MCKKIKMSNLDENREVPKQPRIGSSAMSNTTLTLSRVTSCFTLTQIFFLWSGLTNCTDCTFRQSWDFHTLRHDKQGVACCQSQDPVLSNRMLPSADPRVTWLLKLLIWWLDGVCRKCFLVLYQNSTNSPGRLIWSWISSWYGVLHGKQIS